MQAKTVTIVNPMGMHMRPAGLFAQAMMKYNSEITLVVGDKEINGKSIMNLMAACIKCGTQVELRCEGSDEEAMLGEAVALVESGLGE